MAGDYRIDLTQERHDHGFAYPPVGYTLPYDIASEQPRADFNIKLLAQPAQASGREINPKSPDS